MPAVAEFTIVDETVVVEDTSGEPMRAIEEVAEAFGDASRELVTTEELAEQLQPEHPAAETQPHHEEAPEAKHQRLDYAACAYYKEICEELEHHQNREKPIKE